MKQPRPENRVEKSGVVRSTPFDVERSPKMFDIISSQLYSRPIEAIIRELACNAYDSHCNNGNPDEPFEVKLPTRMDREFYIRDFGEGMAAEKIENLYSTVFSSDKTDTNDQVGYFGLGSKTPFAYKDQFTVESVKDGYQWVYSVHYDEEGIPTLTLMDEGETDKRQGVKISFMAESEDLSTFLEAAGRVFQFFDPRPDVNQSLDYREPGLEGSDWKYFSDFQSKGMFLQMGNVAYKIDDSQVDSSIYHSGLVLEVEMGDVSPTPDREGLQYRDGTVDFIRSKVESFYRDIRTHFQSKFEDIDSFGDRIEAFWNDEMVNGATGLSNMYFLPREFPGDGSFGFSRRAGYMQIRYEDQLHYRKYKLKSKHFRSNQHLTDTTCFAEFDNLSEPGYDRNVVVWSDKYDPDPIVIMVSRREEEEEKIIPVGLSELSRKQERLVYRTPPLTEKAIEDLEYRGVEVFCAEQDRDHLEEELGLTIETKPYSFQGASSSSSDKKSLANDDYLEFFPYDEFCTDPLDRKSISSGRGSYKMRSFWGDLEEMPEKAYYVRVHRFKWSYWESEGKLSADLKDPWSLYSLIEDLKNLGFRFNSLPLIGLKSRVDSDDIPDQWISLETFIDRLHEYFYDLSRDSEYTFRRLRFNISLGEGGDLHVSDPTRPYVNVKDGYSGSIRYLRTIVKHSTLDKGLKKGSRKEEVREKIMDVQDDIRERFEEVLREEFGDELTP